MGIPDFDDDGNLPDGRHRASEEEVREIFALAFDGSRTRQAIVEWWGDLREGLAEQGVLRGHWLAGSFVSDKRDPNDLDLITVLDGEAFDALPRHRRFLIRSLIAGHVTEELWRCDNYPLLEYPDADPAHAPAAATAELWRYHFGHDRSGNARGFVEVPA